MSDEVERRIELAFQAGDFSICECECCLDTENTNTYRPEWSNSSSPVVVYCDGCAEELGLDDG